MNINKPDAILFDWDNTLADTWPVIYESLVKTFEVMGHEPWTLEEAKIKVHRSLRDFFPQIFNDDWQKAAKIYIDYFESIHLDNVVALDGAEQVLDYLQNQNIYLAVVSNKTGYNLRKEVTKIGWDKYFSKIIGAKDASNDKPAVDPVHMALDGSNIKLPSENIWFIGDSVTDLECAKNSGCRAIFYGDADINEERFSHVKPQIHVKDHEEFLELVRKVSG